MRKVRATRGRALVETLIRLGVGPGAALVRSRASKEEIVWGAPSSDTRKSPASSPATGWPVLSRTTASTVTTSIPAGKMGDSCAEAGGAARTARPIQAMAEAILVRMTDPGCRGVQGERRGWGVQALNISSLPEGLTKPLSLSTGAQLGRLPTPDPNRGDRG